MFGFQLSRRSFDSLSMKEMLALAIAAEEEDAHRYRDIAERLRQDFPSSTRVFEEMAVEEDGHRRSLIDLFKAKFGDHIPLVRREDVSGFVRHKPVWTLQPLTIDVVRREAATMEYQAARFYRTAAGRASDPDIRKLLGDLAAAEDSHEHMAGKLEAANLTEDARVAEETTQKRMFVLQYVQPGLAGLMDGSVSTLAPVFAAAFATQNNWETFVIGMAASIGAGISMGFAEALSDDGSMTGRGGPWLRGTVCGIMTTLGGVGHTLPYLVPDRIANAFWIATAIASVIVLIELWAIAWIRAKYMDTPFLRAAFQVVLGGFLVFLTGILLGSA